MSGGIKTRKYNRKRRKTINRYAYIKNGDVVTELNVVNSSDTQIPRNGGPYHYIGSFMHLVSHGHMLLLSRHSMNKCLLRNDKLAVAKVFKSFVYNNLVERLIMEDRTFILILITLLAHKPQWILALSLAVEEGSTSDQSKPEILEKL